MPSVTAMPSNKPLHQTSLRIQLPTAVAEHYQAIADHTGKALEELLSERLTTTADYYDDDPGRPLHFNHSERQELETLLGKNVFSTRDALVLIRNAVSLRTGNHKIALKPELLQKLKSRAIGMDWESFLAQTVTQELERFVGLR